MLFRSAKLEAEAAAKGISSTSVADEARLAVKRAEAAAQRATSMVAAESSHVQTARDHLTDNVLRAKFDGTIAMRFRDDGATVPAGGAIVRIVGRGGPRLRFAVPPDRARAFVLGTRVSATIETIAVLLAGDELGPSGAVRSTPVHSTGNGIDRKSVV